MVTIIFCTQVWQLMQGFVRDTISLIWPAACTHALLMRRLIRSSSRTGAATSCGASFLHRPRRGASDWSAYACLF